MTDWAQLYRAHVRALGDLAAALTPDQVGAPVPASPAWTVHEVYAHLAGVASDMVTGRTDGAPSPEWTSRHVGERVVLPLADLVTELESHQDAVTATLVDSPGPVFDIATHHADLHEALGLHPMPEELWRPVADAVRERAGALADTVSPYELFRAVFSRRSRSQMQGWGSVLSAEELDAVCIFGPREDDQPVPA
ncbi:hypothetical protein G5V58_22465 [Nocardioides anomalus]|uniref:Mycothiol-dependent maleylpyruvate isomerase metal-binding domain-containing protein n=1 Tax=Nocardioides anomalus TaxID=2712223 RepID=A0A6G6WIV8_9ACTN|nr:maleylpyruvate isomerase N-terminal domain-containing protein [Nocardioides anomalus]QIG45159.1 hypothetical protein G5V58_22465 [Nocardioides anomalus]